MKGPPAAAGRYNAREMESFLSWPVLALPFVVGTLGCLLLVVAGRRYVGGRIEAARGPARRAGWLLLAGDGSLALLAAWAALIGPFSPSWSGLLGAASFGAAGFAGLLGGLSGKPRPADGFAALLHVAGACLLVTAA